MTQEDPVEMTSGLAYGPGAMRQQTDAQNETQSRIGKSGRIRFLEEVDSRDSLL